MKNSDDMKLRKLKVSWLRFVPYVALGMLIFSWNSNLEIPSLVKGYLVVFEAQAGLFLLFLLTRKFVRANHVRSD